MRALWVFTPLLEVAVTGESEGPVAHPVPSRALGGQKAECSRRRGRGAGAPRGNSSRSSLKRLRLSILRKEFLK